MMNPLDIHNHFKCSRSAFDGLEEHYYKPVEVKVRANPKIDLSEVWDRTATLDDFVNDIVTPRTDRIRATAEAWERHLLEEAYRMGVWRLWFVQTTIWGENRVDTYTKVFAPWEIKKAQALAKGLGERVVGLSLKKFLLMSDEEFVRESGSSPNFDVVREMRRVMSKRCQRKVRK